MTLAVTRTGRGRPSYVFLHGLLGQGKNWATIAKALEPAASLVVDLPDHGRSSWSERVSYGSMAAEVAHLIDVSGTEPITLVGHSMGGKVAMRVALDHRDRVARLVVVDIAPAASAVKEFRTYVDAMDAIDLDRLGSRGDADAQLVSVAPDSRTRGFLLQSLHREASGWRWAPNLAGLRAGLDEIGSWNPGPALPYPGPVLWIAGAESPYIRPEHMDPMRVLFPRVRLVTVKEAGHWVHADRPAVVADVIRQFVALTPLDPA